MLRPKGRQRGLNSGRWHWEHYPSQTTPAFLHEKLDPPPLTESLFYTDVHRLPETDYITWCLAAVDQKPGQESPSQERSPIQHLVMIHRLASPPSLFSGSVRMRNLTALVLLLLCSMYLVSAGSGAIYGAGQICCGATVRFRIPLKDITSYYKTTSSCPVKAVVFEIKSGRKICVDPNAPWVNGLMESVDLRSKESRRVETSMVSRTSTTAEPPNKPETFLGAQSTTEKPIITEQSITTEQSTPFKHPGTRSNEAIQPCCVATVRFRIPLNEITSYWKTSSIYPVKAVVFELKSGRRICVDPTAPWAEHHMKAVDHRKQIQSTTAEQ